jgi:hypothetical protein
MQKLKFQNLETDIKWKRADKLHANKKIIDANRYKETRYKTRYKPNNQCEVKEPLILFGYLMQRQEQKSMKTKHWKMKSKN